MFFNYRDIYQTMDMTEFFRAKDILSSHGISYKDTSINNQLRLSRNNMGGNLATFSRDGFVNTCYRLAVKKKDEYAAMKALHEELK